MNLKAIVQLLPISLVLGFAAEVDAKPCFADIFYEKMFKPVALKPEPGEGIIGGFRFTAPDSELNTSNIQIKLGNAKGLQIFSRKAQSGWTDNIAEWREGVPSISAADAGSIYHLLVRSSAAGASGILAIEYATGHAPGAVAKTVGKGVFSYTPVGPPSKRVFQAFALGMGGSVAGKNFAAPPGSGGKN
jgi:hypothetical protein